MQQIQNQSLVSFMVANPQQGIAVTNPATGELLGYAPVSTENDILNGIERASVAQKEWAALPAKRALVCSIVGSNFYWKTKQTLAV